MKTAYLGLGSNLGERREHLAGALRELNADRATVIVQGSSLYESKPVGMTDQPDFLNLVVQIETAHLPRELLSFCLGIEARLGRERRERWGPRTIDVDVLAYNDLWWSDDHLVLPHPRMHERSFVLTPLAEIAPDLPINTVSVRDLAARAGSEGLRPIASWQEFSLLLALPQRPRSKS